ncbi:ATP-dependent DNA helicase [Ornithinibacillus halophilus]|uniref:ATP-dependent DNA helicase DinG n=1 Tax=Ornithinibacillus halophilus TaxID=930117 RepID=A0A1M5GD42_9BACI|nr:ATP-dependent DNA helicase [Ornithinibacillus halophilus]SHG01598.1 ATP-dependent DNA helicase DinG [Ornithinibacillus halophilus]
MTKANALPFTVSKTENFFDRLGDYVGDVFYDILPEKGYELRDEQIYMAFQLEQAFKNRSTIFAEAGVGTGKTFVYLLYAICYARYKGKPAIISCADETLIEQLVKKGGDIEKLEEALGLNIDVRLAKARENYVCVRKLDALIEHTEDENIFRVHDEIPDFVFDTSAAKKKFERYGDRKEYPWVPDETWEKIAWDPLQQCSTCDWRHRSGQTLNRDYYRHATDLIICSHDFYMEHVWTKDSRKREGQMALLPEASCVVFDEGHLLEFSAQKGLTYRFNAETLENVLTGYMGQDVTEETLYLIEDILTLHDEWFQMLQQSSSSVKGSNRQQVSVSKDLLLIARDLYEKVERLLDQLVFDSEMFTIDDYHIKIIEEYLEFFFHGLSIFLKSDEGIFWLEENENTTSLVLMPRLVEDVLNKEVFSKDIPFVFSSATLSQNDDFSYLASSLGIEDFDSFTVSSPFDYNEKMTIRGHLESNDKWEKIENQLTQNKGKSLILFSDREEMEQFRTSVTEKNLMFQLHFEGDREISDIVSDFQKDVNSVLCAYHLWEGLDIPGEALTQVIISSLPFPPKDPVFQAKHKHAVDPLVDVDLPYMLLRLRQGIGRLIRTSDDYGSIHLWMKEKEKEKFITNINEVLPVEMQWK